LRVDLVATDGVLGDLRKIKDAHEIQLVRQAITVAQDAFVAVRRQIRPGMTENHLAGLMMLELRARGASDASFPPIIASGAPSSLPHYRPTDAAIKPNRPLLIDWGAFLGGYCSDLTRTLLLGRVAARIRTIYSIVLEAQAAAIAFLRPGVTSRQADSVARRIIAKAGFGKQFGHGLGHGIGREIHEGPALRRKGEAQELLPGMIVTVEPGIYLPGEGGVRIEDDVLITDRGCEVLSSLPKTFDECRIG
jgi:Xaa-Pro aminopeptidase